MVRGVKGRSYEFIGGGEHPLVASLFLFANLPSTVFFVKQKKITNPLYEKILMA